MSKIGKRERDKNIFEVGTFNARMIISVCEKDLFFLCVDVMEKDERERFKNFELFK